MASITLLNGMKDYKINQEIYHKTSEISDYIADISHRVIELRESELVDAVVGYFLLEGGDIIFPAKSYSVAIVYAKLLEKYFSEDFMTALSDQDLFMGTDKFFSPFGTSVEINKIYQLALDQLKTKDLMDFEKSKLSQVKDTVSYFKAEFLVNS